MRLQSSDCSSRKQVGQRRDRGLSVYWSDAASAGTAEASCLTCWQLLPSCQGTLQLLHYSCLHLQRTYSGSAAYQGCSVSSC